MLSIIYKNLCTVAIQDQTKLQLPILAVHKTSSLMNDCSSGTGEFTVNFQYRFIRTEAYCSMTGFILSKTNCKFLINILCISWTKCDLHIHTSAGYTVQTDYILKSNIFVLHFVCAEVLQFTDRFLDQSAILNRKLSWKTHLSKPFALWNSIIRTCIPVLHPANHNSSAVRCFHCLHCIIVDTIVYCLVLFRNKGLGFLIKFTDKAKSSISIVILKAFRKHILRTYQHHIFSIQCKEIRALPHFSEAAIIRKHNRFKFPVISICTLIEKNTSSCTIHSVIYHHTAIRAILTFPHFRIAKIKRTAVLWHIFHSQNRVSHILLIVHSISDCKALCLDITDTAVRLRFFTHTGIHKKLLSIRKLKGTS